MDFDLVSQLGPQVAALLALIAADVLLAVALAIRQEEFNWQELPRFYRTMVIPLLVGYVAFAVLAEFAAPSVLGDEYGVLAADGVQWAAWLAIVVSIGDSIRDSAGDLYGELNPIE